MPFQPLGYRFEVLSTMPLAEARASLRARRTGWFDPQSGPRGWIVGPVFCLWLSAFDQYGPMVFGIIGEQNRGTRVQGLAGSDLNGVLMFTLLIPLMAFIAFQLILEDAASLRQLLVIGAILLVGGPLMFWSAHKDRRQAEPLIDFVESALVKVRSRPKACSSSRSADRRDLRLIVGKDEQSGSAVTVDAVCNAVEAIRYDPHGLVVLQLDEQRYMQSAAKDGGFILEKREGASSRHFIAERSDSTGRILSADEITAALLDYLGDRSATPGLRWEHLGL